MSRGVVEWNAGTMDAGEIALCRKKMKLKDEMGEGIDKNKLYLHICIKSIIEPITLYSKIH